MRRFAIVAVLVAMVVLAVGCRYVPNSLPEDALVRDPGERMLLAVEVGWSRPHGYSGGGSGAGVRSVKMGRRTPVDDVYSPRRPLARVHAAAPVRGGPLLKLGKYDLATIIPRKPPAGQVAGRGGNRVAEGRPMPAVTPVPPALPAPPAPRLVVRSLKDVPRWEALPAK